jgi:hypothetical protein
MHAATRRTGHGAAAGRLVRTPHQPQTPFALRLLASRRPPRFYHHSIPQARGRLSVPGARPPLPRPSILCPGRRRPCATLEPLGQPRTVSLSKPLSAAHLRTPSGSPTVTHTTLSTPAAFNSGICARRIRAAAGLAFGRLWRIAEKHTPHAWSGRERNHCLGATAAPRTARRAAGCASALRRARGGARPRGVTPRGGARLAWWGLTAAT